MYISVWVSLFNGISAFIDYLMPKTSLLKNSHCRVKSNILDCHIVVN